MFSKLWQLIVSLAIIAIALGVGFVAAGIVDPSPFRASPPSGGAVGSPDAPTSRPSPTLATAPAGTTPVGEDVAVLVGAGDIASCDRFQDELTADLVESIEGTVITLGDNADPDGSLQHYEDCYTPSWGRESIKDRTRPAVGDNDYETLNARGYFAYFGRAAGDPARGYYAYDAGTWRVYVLNTECARIGGCGTGSPQETWLLEDLAAEQRDCVLAVMHRPYFTSGPSGGGSSATRNLWRVLQEARAELVLSGHDHHYERFAPQRGDGTADPKGIVQFVVGTGGARPDDIQVVSLNSEAQATDVAGVLRLELGREGYAFEFTTVWGKEFRDSGSGKCH